MPGRQRGKRNAQNETNKMYVCVCVLCVWVTNAFKSWEFAEKNIKRGVRTH